MSCFNIVACGCLHHLTFAITLYQLRLKLILLTVTPRTETKMLANKYLIVLHFFIILVALAYITVAVYYLVEGTNYFPSAAAQYAWTTYAPLVFGIVVLLVALVGCFCVALRENKCFAAVFAVLQLVFGLSVVISGVVLIVVSTNFINVIVDTPVVSKGMDAALIVFNVVHVNVHGCSFDCF